MDIRLTSTKYPDAYLLLVDTIDISEITEMPEAMRIVKEKYPWLGATNDNCVLDGSTLVITID